MKTLEYLIKANSSDFVTAVTKAETIYGQALKGMADKAKQISLFKQAKDEADSTGTALVKLKTTAEQVRKALGDSGGTLQQNQQLAQTEAAINKTEAAMRGQVAAVGSMRQALAAAGVDTRNLAAEQDKMASAIARASGNVNGQRRLDGARDVLGIRSQTDIQREIQQVSAAFSRLSQNPTISMAELSRAATATKARIAELRAELQGTMPASSFLMSGAGKLVAMASAVVSLNAALALTRSILSTAGQFETLRTQLNAVEKSATKGGEAFAYIKQQAVNTPFQVTNLTQTYIRLRNYGLDPTAGSMQAIIDQAAKLGASQEMLERITLALGQAWTKQKLQGEEIMQLNEAGVPVWDLLSKAMNKSAAELMKMSENGQLGREEITKLMQAMENDAAGAAASQMQTWNGVVSNATDLWQEFLDSIGQAGLLQFAKDSINQLTAALQKMKETGELSRIAHDIADALQALGKIAIGTAKFITNHHDAILAVATVYGALAAKKLFAGLATDLVTFGTAASKAATALKELKEAQTVGDIVNTVVGKGGVKKAAPAVKAATTASTIEAAGTAAAVGAATGGAKTADTASKVGQAASKTVQVASQAASKAWGGLSAEMTLGGTRLVSVFSAVAMRLGLVTSQQTAGTTGLDSDFQKAARDASAAETAFSRVMEVINQLRTNGKITEGEFNFMNDQAGRAQDSADAGMEKTAKSTMQKAMEQIEAIKAAAAAVQKLDISVSINDQQALQDMDSMINRIQQAATAKPVKIAVELVGPDGKYRTDARSALSLVDRPLSEIQSNAEGGAISGPGTGTSDSILSWLSNGEFVVKAAATSYYGPGLLQAINQMRLPRFAVGGAVGQLPAVSRAMAGIPTMQAAAAASQASQKTPLNIYLPGQAAPVPLYGDDDAVQQLVKAATLMNLKQG
ncbi:tape measure protein [Aquitalea pelogenes]|uniref:tape measure protein n=1 Tax=Aquitalea pelogenes TaxID=1293573 RepID=UPI0035AEAAA4